jgi:hypothetical protein
VDFLIALGAVVVVSMVMPMHCQGVISRPPYRGCHKMVVGLLGYCRNHGFQPGRRVVRLAGGPKLPLRRVCHNCGQPRVFGRLQDTGKPFLGCTGYPACKSPRFLAG